MTIGRSIAIATILATCLVTASNADPHTEAGATPLSALVESLGNGDAKIRKEAAEALLARSAEADAGMGGMTGFLTDDDVATMERFRNEARPIISALAKLLQSPYEESRVAAECALGAIGPDAKACRPALRKIIRDGRNSRGFRMAAVPALLMVTPAGEVAGRDFLEDFISPWCAGANELETPDSIESRMKDDEALAGWSGGLLAVTLIVTGRT